MTALKSRAIHGRLCPLASTRLVTFETRQALQPSAVERCGVEAPLRQRLGQLAGPHERCSGSGQAGDIWMPYPPCPTNQKKPSTSSSKPATGERSATKLRKPAHDERTCGCPAWSQR